jgi:hypothetical protein
MGRRARRKNLLPKTSTPVAASRRTREQEAERDYNATASLPFLSTKFIRFSLAN